MEPTEHLEHHQEVIDKYFSSVPGDVEDDLDHPVCVRSVETGEECDKCLCVYCGKLYASSSTRQAHLTRGCKERPRSRKGTKADRKVQQLKRVQQQAERQHVSMQGKELTNLSSTWGSICRLMGIGGKRCRLGWRLLECGSVIATRSGAQT